MFGKKFLTSSIRYFCKYGEIMKYQIYILPKKRDKFFQHFLSDTAEDKYLNNYRVFENEIETNERFFDFAAKQISVPILSVTRGDFYLANFLRVYDNLQNKYYYYDVLDVAKQTQNIIIYNVKLDEYHTIFNNRGSDYNFLGYLRNSNTRTILDEDKIFAEPSNSFSDFETELKPFNTVDNIPKATAVIAFKGSLSGVNVAVLSNDSQDVNSLIRTVAGVAKAGKLKYVYYQAEPNTQGFIKIEKDENIEIINAYIVPFYFIGARHGTDFLSTYWTNGSTNFELFDAAGKVSQNFSMTDEYRFKIIEFGTFSSRLRLSPSCGNIVINAKMTKLSDGVEITLWNGTQKISITKDFTITVASSAINQYINSNSISNSLRILAGVGKVIGGAVSGNAATAGSGIASVISTAADTASSGLQTGQIYGNSAAELSYNFLPNYKADPFYLWIFEPKNAEYLRNIKLNYGGYCNEIGVSFSSMKIHDKTKPSNNAYNYYEFSKIVSDYPQANRIAPLLLGGIEMEFLD